jgi:glycosyltransferase involved in cell wall biosynthesis
VSAVRASVLVPTHDHATTLPLTVGSVLRQTVQDLEVLVIGDGVTPESRAAAEALVATDDRVRFLDFPKGPHHGEVHRHEAVLAARSDAIFYLCDDDLLLPDHVADLLGLLEGANFVQSRNGFVREDGQVELYPADLSDRECVDWHLLVPRRCMTSITGSAHSRAYYLEVGDPWETTPPGEWPDHYQWKKFFRRADFRGATSRRMTALQFPTSQDGRDRWSPEERLAELVPWAERIAEPGAQERLDALVDRATQVTLVRYYIETDLLREQLAAAHAELTARGAYLRDAEALLAERDEALRRLRARVKQRTGRLAEVERELASLRRSRSWRVTQPLRALGDAVRSRRDRRPGQ